MKGFRKTISNNSKTMLYTIYDDKQILRGTFESIYDLERFIDAIRIERNEQFPNTPRSSPFDYVKSIGWFWEIADNHAGVDKVASSEV